MTRKAQTDEFTLSGDTAPGNRTAGSGLPSTERRA